MTAPLYLTTEQRERVLAEVTRLRTAGQGPQARVILRAVLGRYPDEVALWLQLALVAADRAEQRAALETALQLEPGNPLALRGLQRFAAPPAVAPPAVAPPAVAPPAVETARRAVSTASMPPPAAPRGLDRPARQLRNALFALAGILGVLVLLGLLARALNPAAATSAEPTVALPTNPPTSLPIGSPVPVTVVVSVVASPPPPTPAPVTVVVTVVASRVPPPTADTSLARPGQVYQQGPWQITLLRPDYARTLAGAIGTLQPTGRFVLVLLTVGRSGTSAPLPLDQIALVDSRGARYRPLVGASRQYLAAYGRGQYGDLSDDEPIPAQSNVSVPLIFDIPADAAPHALMFGAVGWQLVNR